MTRKDYVLIAEAVHRSVIAKSLEGNAVKRMAAKQALNLVTIDLAASLANDNPRFDQERFLAACGINQ